MGPKHSTDEQNKKVKINHPKFSQAELLNDNQVLRTYIPIQNESHFEEWSNKLNKISHLDDEILLLPRSYRYVKRAICGSSGQLNIDFDKYNFILEEELKNRRHIRRFFEEGELWYLIYSLVYAAHDFKKVNSKIGDVRPLNIFINQSGQVKIANMFSWPNEPSNYIKTLEDNQKTYLSPEEMGNIKNGDSQNYIDKYSSQSFSIGLTMLQAGLMRDMSPLYNSFAREFDQSRLNLHLKDWYSLLIQQTDNAKKNKQPHSYSDALKVTIAAMCQIDMRNRLTSQQVYQWLEPNSKHINYLQQFKKTMPPVKDLQRYSKYLGHSPNNDWKTTQTKNNPPNTFSTYRDYFHQYSALTGHNPSSNNPNPNYNNTNTSSLPTTNYSSLYSPIASQYPLHVDVTTRYYGVNYGAGNPYGNNNYNSYQAAGDVNKIPNIYSGVPKRGEGDFKINETVKYSQPTNYNSEFNKNYNFILPSSTYTDNLAKTVQQRNYKEPWSLDAKNENKII